MKNNPDMPDVFTLSLTKVVYMLIYVLIIRPKFCPNLICTAKGNYMYVHIYIYIHIYVYIYNVTTCI